MTCIVGLADASGVYIGGDSAEMDDHLHVNVRSEAKVFKRGNFVFGFADSFRVGQLLRYRMTIPAIRQNDLVKYMVVDFVDALRKCLKRAGSSRKSEDEESFSGEIMVGIRGRLFVIYTDYQVAEIKNGIQAIGCGREYALGAMFSTMGQDPSARINKALEAASFYSAGVKPPFKIMRVPGTTITESTE